MRFDGQIVAVTGAGSGFGREIATAYARSGARVYASDKFSECLNALPADADIVHSVVDVTDRATAADWIAQIEAQESKAVDVLINNAGGAAGRKPQPIESVLDADWDDIIEINLSSTFNLCKAVVPAMKRAKAGRIINISSGAGVRASFFNVQAYGAAKHGVVGLTRILAQELGEFGITVNAIAPGLVLTCERQERQWQSYGEEGQKNILKRLALRRLATPQDISDTALFLGSSYAAGITGEVLAIGLTA